MVLVQARRRLTGVAAVAVAAALLLSGCASGDHGASTAETATFEPGRAGDVAFAQLMIPHHEQAVEMAELALAADADASGDVRALATAIQAAQDPEIALMTQWLTQWGEPVAMPGSDESGVPDDHSGHDMGGMSMAGMMSAEDMGELGEATGTDFDRMWLAMMIAHHEGAVDMAEQVLTTTEDPAVRTLAEEIVAAQQAEIATMRGLLGGETTSDATEGAGAGGASGDGGPAAGAQGPPVAAGDDWGHVHNLAWDGGALLLGTHDGLWRQEPGQAATLVSEQPFDVMGLARNGSRWLASGHPGPGQDLPADLGLRASTDGGRTWAAVSLEGDVDFHRLVAVGDVVLGVSAHDNVLLRSEDGGASWADLGAIGVFDLAVDPADPSVVVATTQDGPRRSTDGGWTWEPISGAPLIAFVAWSGDTLTGVDPEGGVLRSTDSGRTWSPVGEVGGQPGALAVDVDTVAVLVGDTVVTSTDGGVTFAPRITGIGG
ncbi:MAG: DUF305 domain-containing protein [Candidatus Nanopelagicales bacterium]